MSPNILIVREGNSYRLLHGLLHLTRRLSVDKELLLEVKDEGTLKLVRTASGICVCTKSRRAPLIFS
jgi:hypothetical protein